MERGGNIAEGGRLGGGGMGGECVCVVGGGERGLLQGSVDTYNLYPYDAFDVSS